MISDTEGEICQFMPEQAYIWSTENTKFFFFYLPKYLHGSNGDSDELFVVAFKFP